MHLTSRSSVPVLPFLSGLAPEALARRVEAPPRSVVVFDCTHLEALGGNELADLLRVREHLERRQLMLWVAVRVRTARGSLTRLVPVAPGVPSRRSRV